MNDALRARGVRAAVMRNSGCKCWITRQYLTRVQNSGLNGIHSPHVQFPHLVSFDSISERVSHYGYWQYGADEHSSPKQNILGSFNISCLSNLGRPVRIVYLVLEGPSPWVIGHNVTQECNMLQINNKSLQFTYVNVVVDYLENDWRRKWQLYLIGSLHQCPNPVRFIFPNIFVMVGNSWTTLSSSLHITRPISNLTRIVVFTITSAAIPLTATRAHFCSATTYGTTTCRDSCQQ